MPHRPGMCCSLDLKEEQVASAENADMRQIEDAAEHSNEDKPYYYAWTCSKCTFIHEGQAKFEYLACEICGSLKE